MDLSKIRSITNDYRDVRLVSLHSWKQAAEIQPKDQGGPYLVTQEGYDPQDLTMSYDEFLLGKSGAWITIGMFLRLPKDARRQEFVFGEAGEVIRLLEGLIGKPKILRKGNELTPAQAEEDDDLNAAFKAAKESAATKKPS